MAVKNTRKKLSKKQKKKFYRDTTISALLCLLVLSISYLMYKTNILQPSVNEVTASYISFNNKDTTDEIKINNLKKMSVSEGKSIINNKSNKLLITGEENTNYKVIVYPVINNIDLKYINYSINIKGNTYNNALSEMPINNDGGIVIYEGVIKKEKNLLIRMWVSNNYPNKVDNNSFRIKIKQSEMD